MVAVAVGRMKLEVSITFLIGVALGYYAAKHYMLTGKGA